MALLDLQPSAPPSDGLGVEPPPAGQQVDLPAVRQDAGSFFETSLQRDEYCLRVTATGSYRVAFQQMFPQDSWNDHATLAVDPDITARVSDLTTARHQLPISLTDHADRIAEIRDLAQQAADFRTALVAETKLGELRGFYVKQVRVEQKQYVVQLPPPQKSMDSWAERYGRPAQVENPAIDVKATHVPDD